jgi:L-lactate permease
MLPLRVLSFGKFYLFCNHNILTYINDSVFIAIFGWKMPAVQAFESIGNGIVYANWPIMWIVFNAM